MNYHGLRHQLPEGHGPTGLALVELIISAALVAVLTVAVSLTVFSSHKRSSEVRTTLGELATRDFALRHLSDNLRWATSLGAGDVWQVLCQVPRADNPHGAPDTIGYQWDANNRQLRCFRPGHSPQVIAGNVSVFQAAISPVEDNPSRLSALTIKLQVGSDPAGLKERTIVLVNKPDLAMTP